MSDLVGIAGFGAAGAALRYTVDHVVSQRYHSFPYGTLAVNLVGSFVLGTLSGMMASDDLSAGTMALLGTGFCGGLTTFSTFSFETGRLIEERRSGAALLNALGNVAGSVAAAGAGIWLVGH